MATRTKKPSDAPGPEAGNYNRWVLAPKWAVDHFRLNVEQVIQVPPLYPGGRPEERYLVRISDTWLEQEVQDVTGSWWRVAHRIVSHRNGQPIVGETRVFPLEAERRAQVLRGRREGIWAAEYIGYRATSPAPVTSRLLKRLPVGERDSFWQRCVEIYAREAIQHGTFKGDPQHDWIVAAAVERVTATTKGEPGEPRGRPKTPDPELAALAAEYVMLLQQSKSDPIQHLAQRHRLKPAAIRSRINTARKRLLLSRSPGRGHLGGTLTPYAKSLLSSSALSKYDKLTKAIHAKEK